MTERCAPALVLLFLAALVFPGAAAHAATRLHFTDGTHVDVKSYEERGDKIVYQGDRGGIMAVPRSDVSRIEKTAPGLIVEHWRYDEYEDAIVGTVLNDSPRAYQYLQISFRIYDPEGNLVDTLWTNIGGLAGGERWKFRVGLFGRSSVKRYSEIKFDKLSGN